MQCSRARQPSTACELTTESVRTNTMTYIFCFALAMQLCRRHTQMLIGAPCLIATILDHLRSASSDPHTFTRHDSFRSSQQAYSGCTSDSISWSRNPSTARLSLTRFVFPRFLLCIFLIFVLPFIVPMPTTYLRPFVSSVLPPSDR